MVIYKCDACGCTVSSDDDLHSVRVDGYECKGFSAVACMWSGEVCLECLNAIEYEADAAKMKEIERIQYAKGLIN